MASGAIPLSTELRMVAGRARQRVKNLSGQLLAPGGSPRPFFILTSERTGSNLLVDYLRSLPDVEVVGEALSPLLPIGIRTRFVTRRAVLRHLRRTLARQSAPIVGAKLMFWHLHEIHGLGVEDLAKFSPDARFIVLYRSSLAEQYVSHRIAERTGQFLVREGGTPKTAKVVVDPADFREYSARIRRHYERVVSVPWMRERAVIVSYRELVEDPMHLLRDRLAPLLSTRFEAPKSDLVRQNPAPLAEKVANYADVEDVLTGPDSRNAPAFADAGAE